MRISARTLGWYHIAGAVAGGVLTVWASARGAAPATGTFATAALPFAFSMAAGRMLLLEWKHAQAVAALVQLLQIPIVILPAVTWKFIAGIIASITLTARGIGLYGGLEATWYVGTGDLGELPATLGVNLAPVIVLVLLARMRSEPAAEADGASPPRPAV